MPGRGTPEPLLEVRNLRVAFGTEMGAVRALFGVSFSVDRGETVGLVGESGCGKTVTALSVLRLLQSPPAIVEGGEILLKGENLLSLPEKRMCDIRGRAISMIFQEPMSSLNPVLTVGDQVAEVFTAHGVCGKRDAAARAVEWLRKVRMPDPERRAKEYPHQMSGGMRQRAMIAMALAMSPSLVIADEPTTALDVTIQAQIMALLQEMREQERMAVLLITHDLGVVHDFADRTAIMYLGRIVEIAPTKELFADPIHPYTQGLLASLPGKNRGEKRLPSIPGTVPDLSAVPPGCPFADRCPFRRAALERVRSGQAPADSLAVCDREDPPLSEYAPGHLAACHHQRAVRGGGMR
ncbi:MAG: oligopeptide/dipeptide transporter, ATPase subunit [Deltaproteobacteria bacterium]|nr:oligopeptide/dipeptide transporter, ATPase subunit [Deltaproteobacteria bacterium]